MLDTNYNDFVNEEMSFISTQKLRDALHDIVVALGPKEILDVEELVNLLQTEYKITISPFFLDKFLDDFLRVKRGDRKAKTFFLLKDTKWLGVRDVAGTKQVRNNLLHLKPVLTKHKRTFLEGEEKRKLDNAYKEGMPGLNFKEEVIKKSLVLQKQEDSEDLIKFIYSDVMIDKKYENTYDNCWKLMMLFARSYNLDRRRGWFKLAPKSVKDAYYAAPEGQKRINYELTKPPKKDEKKEEKIEEPITKTPQDEEEKENLKVIDSYLHKYKNWIDFTNRTNLKELVGIIDSLKTSTVFGGRNFEEFLAKIDQLNFILFKYYRVDRKDILIFYAKIGLAGFMKKWEADATKPIINDF